MTCSSRPSGASSHWSTSSRGTTSTCPGPRGLIERKATTRSSDQTKRPGSSPLMIFVKTVATPGIVTRRPRCRSAPSGGPRILDLRIGHPVQRLPLTPFSRRKPDAALARHVLSPGRDLRRGRDQLRALQRGRRARHAVSVRRDRRGDPRAPCRSGTGSSGTATCPASSPGSATATASRARTTRSRGSAATPQAAHRPVRQGARRHAGHHVRVGRGALRRTTSTTPTRSTTTTRRSTCPSPW